MELATKTLQQLLFRAAGARQSHTYSPLEMEQAIRDREEWILSGSIEAPGVLAVANKWRHWKPGKIQTQLPTSQRALEQHLRARWLERLLGYFIPFRHQIPYMHQVMGAKELRRRGAVANRMNFARAPLQGLMSRTRSGRSTMAQKGEQTHTSRPTQRRRPLHRWSETASTPSTGSGQRRTTPIYFGPRSQTLRRDFGMSTSRCRGSPQVPRALRGTPAAPACPPGPRG